MKLGVGAKWRGRGVITAAKAPPARARGISADTGVSLALLLGRRWEEDICLQWSASAGPCPQRFTVQHGRLLGARATAAATPGHEGTEATARNTIPTIQPTTQKKEMANASGEPSSSLRQESLTPTQMGSASSAGENRCVDAAEACTADTRCQRLRTEYVALCLGRAGTQSCHRARCHHALRRFFARGPPALTHALLFCRCASPECAERRRQTFVPACAFYGPGAARPSCLETLDACAQSRVCRPRLLVFQASCLRVPSAPDGCLRDQGPRCLRAYAGLVGTAITPNYLDNASARVAPWCDCRASGNRREECEAFRDLFTRNQCLDGAIQAFESGWSGILQVQLDSQQEPGHNLLQVSSAAGPLEGSSLLSIFPVLALQALL